MYLPAPSILPPPFRHLKCGVLFLYPSSMLFTTFLALMTIASGAGTALAIPMENELDARGPPANWDYEGLEPYTTYNRRYMALDCRHMHNTKFFKVCCGPLRRNKPLSARPDACDPAKTYWAEDCGADEIVKY